MLFKTWDSLTNFESFELVKNDYMARHGRKISLSHAREISAPFNHARSYFRAADLSEPTIKPLLLYYGVTNLARGATLALSRGLREAALAPSHGLSVKDWANELSRDNPDFGSLKISVNASGTFTEVGRATQFRSLLKHGSSVVTFNHVNIPAAAGTEVSFAGILSRTPMLFNHYKLWNNQITCLPIDTIADGPNAVFKLSKTTYKWINYSTAKQVFDGTDYQFNSESEAEITYEGPRVTSKPLGLTDCVNHSVFGMGHIWLVKLYSGYVTLSKLQTLHALSYVLGMLVRYYPTQWTALIRGHINDGILPTLKATIDLVEQEYPQTVLEFLISTL